MSDIDKSKKHEMNYKRYSTLISKVLDRNAASCEAAIDLDKIYYHKNDSQILMESSRCENLEARAMRRKQHFQI